ncbi:unnamed protein product [Heterosigma akashiwo]
MSMVYEGSPIEDTPSRLVRVTRLFISALGAATLAGIFFFAYLQYTPVHNLTPELQFFADESNSGSLKLEATNKYSKRDGSPVQQYAWLVDNLLAEPYRETTFRVVDYDPTKEYAWEIHDEESGDIEFIFAGHEFVHTFSKPDVWSDKSVVVMEYETDVETNSRTITNSGSTKLYVRYVRREIRNLFEEDREELLDAMVLHWHVDQAEGTVLYGEDYRSMLTMLKYHLSAAGDYECDHYHDGFGFLQHHGAITILFEQSLQAINPKIAMPYWDYIYDMEQFSQAGKGFLGFNNGELFSKDFFGSTDGDNHIHDGRWAGLTMPTVDDLGSELEKSQIPHNAHGFLRSPWSMNHNDELMRASSTCGVDPYYDGKAATCEALATLTAKASFMDWYEAASYQPHGPAHILTGGVTGDCETYWDAVEAAGVGERANGTDVSDWRKWTSFYIKNGWRYDLIDCSSKEGCECVHYEDYIGDVNLAFAFLQSLDVIRASAVKDMLEDDDIFLLVDAVCKSSVYVGDNLQSSSSWSPEFWTIHGTVERMYQLRMAKAPWEDGAYTWYKASWMITQERCEGHSQDDLVLLGRDAVKVKGVRTEYSIKDFLEFYDLDKMVALDYIYDNLDYAYCGLDSLVV